MNLHPSIGQTFSTPFEDGCVALTEVDAYGEFNALDSEGVECAFSVAMVTSVSLVVTR